MDIIECCLGTPPQKNHNEVRSISLSVPSKDFPRKSSEKVFTARESPLTEIFTSKHGSSLYIICMVLSIVAVASSAITSLANNEELQVGHDILWHNVTGIPLTMVCWLATYSLVIVFYAIFRFWAIKRQTCGSPLILNSLMFIPVTVTTFLLLTFPAASALLLDLPLVCRFGLLMEQIRFLLKLYSFLRAKLPDAYAGCTEFPGWTEIVIFFTVPTMIYKDCYPRSDKIRWQKFLLHSFELVYTGVIGAYLVGKVHTSAVVNFRSVWLDATSVLIALVSNLVPTTLILLVGFFGYFHSFCNLTAELTGFQDRLFYKDWWTASSFKTFFTSWNTLIQDWLYYHVYLDVRIWTGNSQLAEIAVFIVSGILHEYVLSFFFGFFYPVMAVVFVGVGSILKAIPTSKVSTQFGNWVLWLCIPLGSGIIFTSYMTEISSRANCPYPPGTESWSDYFVPRSWSCPLTGEENSELL